MPDMLSKEAREFLEAGGDPNDPNAPAAIKTELGTGPKDDPRQTGIPGQPWADPNDPRYTPPKKDQQSGQGDLFTLVRNGEEHQFDRSKVVQLAQQGFDYAEKMKELNDRIERETEQRIGQMIREGKLLAPGQTPSPPQQPQPPREPLSPVSPPYPSPYGPQYPPNVRGFPVPPTQTQQPAPVDEFGFPIQQPQYQVPLAPAYPNPEVDILRNQVAQMNQTIAELTNVIDQSNVDSQTRRLSALMREAQQKMPRMNAKEVLLEISRMGEEAERLQDSDILAMCKQSHDTHQAEFDQHLLHYLENKRKQNMKAAPNAPYQGTGIPIPEKPLTNFDDARAAAEELLKNIS